MLEAKGSRQRAMWAGYEGQSKEGNRDVRLTRHRMGVEVGTQAARQGREI